MLHCCIDWFAAIQRGSAHTHIALVLRSFWYAFGRLASCSSDSDLASRSIFSMQGWNYHDLCFKTRTAVPSTCDIGCFRLMLEVSPWHYIACTRLKRCTGCRPFRACKGRILLPRSELDRRTPSILTDNKCTLIFAVEVSKFCPDRSWFTERLHLANLWADGLPSLRRTRLCSLARYTLLHTDRATADILRQYITPWHEPLAPAKARCTQPSASIHHLDHYPALASSPKPLMAGESPAVWEIVCIERPEI